MDRLLAGDPKASDGRLTIVNLAIEAGVSRATANRAEQIIADFRHAIAKAAGQRADDQVVTVTDKDQGRRADDNLIAQHVQARALLKRHNEQRAARILTVASINTPRKS
jgi:ribosomal protein L14